MSSVQSTRSGWVVTSKLSQPKPAHTREATHDESVHTRMHAAHAVLVSGVHVVDIRRMIKCSPRHNIDARLVVLGC